MTESSAALSRSNRLLFLFSAASSPDDWQVIFARRFSAVQATTG